MTDILSMRNVTAWRGDTRVFHELSLEIPEGCNAVVLGPNGAGKSTLLKLLTREILPEHREGSTLRLFGRERWNVWDLRSRLGVVSHELQTGYAGHFTGWDVVLSGHRSTLGVWAHHRFTDAERARARELLERLDVEPLAGKPYATLSTGEQRRFLLARALVHDPEVLVLDEPTSGLDLKACFQYIEIVRSLMRSGKTVILVTHHIHEIPPEIQRVVLLKGGRVLADGPRSEVLTDRRLTDAFDTPVDLVEANGFVRAVPGKPRGGPEP